MSSPPAMNGSNINSLLILSSWYFNFCDMLKLLRKCMPQAIGQVRVTGDSHLGYSYFMRLCLDLKVVTTQTTGLASACFCDDWC